ncbi:unnamed protein product [Pleuronectes platessa]|uniref:Uncharacterized protein n=1 Tax=Pleuronectes platessa TaxID=8262 RepID=A0A9N7V3U1_PLEPL|nr:unnamed protein product [Pleuronectes platessa]
MTHSPQVGHPRSPWQASLGPPQHGPVSPRPREPWLVAKASAAPATCWAHQSAFVSLVSHCIIRTKGPATRAPTAPLCPELAFPKLPNSLPSPLHRHPELKSHTPPPTTGPQPVSSRRPPTAPPWPTRSARCPRLVALSSLTSNTSILHPPFLPASFPTPLASFPSLSHSAHPG